MLNDRICFQLMGFLVVAAALLLAKSAAAVVLTASADTYIYDYIGDAGDAIPTPVGGLLNINARYNSGGTERQDLIVVRFDISGLSGTVASASFNVTAVRDHSNRALNLFGATHAVAGLWNESTVTWSGDDVVDPTPIVYDVLPFMYSDGPAHSLNDEIADGSSLYDQWDLIPNGNTGTNGMLVQELMGTEAEAGVNADIDWNDTLSLSDASITNFLQTAINNGDNSVTFVLATRTASSSQFKLYSKEATNFTGAANGSGTGDPLTDAARPNLDITILIPGDLDGNGNVDGDDFALWQLNFPTQSGTPYANGDGDGDGDVDGADFVVWQTNFPFPSLSNASTVPEPSALILACCCAVGLAFIRQRPC
jgi:hypothetical protein